MITKSSFETSIKRVRLVFTRYNYESNVLQSECIHTTAHFYKQFYKDTKTFSVELLYKLDKILLFEN